MVLFAEKLELSLSSAHPTASSETTGSYKKQLKSELPSSRL